MYIINMKNKTSRSKFFSGQRVKVDFTGENRFVSLFGPVAFLMGWFIEGDHRIGTPRVLFRHREDKHI